MNTIQMWTRSIERRRCFLREYIPQRQYDWAQYRTISLDLATRALGAVFSSISFDISMRREKRKHNNTYAKSDVCASVVRLYAMFACTHTCMCACIAAAHDSVFTVVTIDTISREQNNVCILLFLNWLREESARNMIIVHWSWEPFKVSLGEI